MKRLMTIAMLLTALFVASAPHEAQAQLKKLRKKVEEATSKPSGSSASQDKANQTPASTEGRKLISPSEREAMARAEALGLTDEQAAELLAFYKPLGRAADHFPAEMRGDNLQGTNGTKSCDANSYVDAFEQLDWPALSQRMAQDQAQFPAVFAYYGIEEPGRYADMVYGGNQRAPWEGVSNVAGELNSTLQLIYEWRGKLAGKERELAQNIQQYLNLSQTAQAIEKVDCALMAVRFVSAVRSVQPDNPMLADLESEADRALDKQLATISHLITGPFHKSHLRQVAVFGAGFQLGSETEAAMLKTVTPAEPATLVGYFQSSNKDAGGIPTLTWFEVTDQYYEDKANGFADPSPDQYLPMYAGDRVKDKLEAQGHMTFDLFPDPERIAYESHLQYLPHLHFVRFLTQQLPGTYTYKFVWGKNNAMASGMVTLEITPERREALRAYYDRLMQRKIDSVTFPMESCQDQRGQITNAGDMAKYGTLLKVSFEQTGDIMFPWPRDHEVQWNTAAGWAAFEKDDGRVEVIPLEFRKTPSESQWNFHSVGFTPSDYALTGKVNINPELLQFGYEMRKANVNTCKAW